MYIYTHYSHIHIYNSYISYIYIHYIYIHTIICVCIYICICIYNYIYTLIWTCKMLQDQESSDSSKGADLQVLGSLTLKPNPYFCTCLTRSRTIKLTAVLVSPLSWFCPIPRFWTNEYLNIVETFWNMFETIHSFKSCDFCEQTVCDDWIRPLWFGSYAAPAQQMPVLNAQLLVILEARVNIVRMNYICQDQI